MPPKRKPAATRQPTLTFNTKSKVTKPATRANSKKSEPISAPAPASTLPSSSSSSPSSSSSSSGLRTYYASILASRISRPLHQTNQTLEEKILRHFDLSSQFGPCIGISRLERWKRAQRLGLAPPKEVLDVAVRMEVVERNVENLALKRDTRKAYIDDFLAGRGEE